MFLSGFLILSEVTKDNDLECCPHLYPNHNSSIDCKSDLLMI